MSYPKRGLSIDIGNERIKIIEYQKNKDKIKVKNALLLDTPDGAVEDGAIIKTDEIVDLIVDSLKVEGIKSKQVIFSIASSKIITRELDLPDIPKKKLDTMVSLNAEEQFPVNLAEYITDYRIQDKFTENDEQMVRTNIVAAYAELVNSYIELSNRCGLKMAGIDYAGNSIVSFCEKLEDDGTYMLLDFGSTSTMVTIMSGGKVRFSRNLVYGMRMMINSIKEHFGVSYDEAVKIASDQTLLKHESDSNDYLSSDTSAALNQILNGISRLLDYYSSRNKDNVSDIYVSGGGSHINGLPEYVSEYFNIEVKKVDNLAQVSSQSDNFSSNQDLYLIALGTIYSTINLLPKDILNKDKAKAAMRLKVELGVLAAIMIGVVLYLPYLSVQDLKEQIVVLQSEKEEKMIVIPLKAEFESIKQKEKFYVEMDSITYSTTEVVADVLGIMEKELPSDVGFMSITNTETGMLISAEAMDKLTVVNLIKSLKKMEYSGMPLFSRVYIPGITSTGEDGQEFLDGEYQTSFDIICDYYLEVE